MVLLEPSTWDWATLGNTFVGAGVGTALVQSLFSLIRERAQTKKQATYLATRLAITLEFFAQACAELISTNRNAETPRGHEFPAWKRLLPDLPTYPDDAGGWLAIDRSLADRCLHLRNKIYASQQAIDFTTDFATHELGDTLDEEAAACGLEAWKLALELRKKYKLTPADIRYDIVEALEHVVSERGLRKAAALESGADLLGRT
ncbi:hypothetical protein [Methylocystis echinoides]|uniref:Uncharacterized protein n=1 Tax=Methylocystis echinoides TaxID=29468 RepID=A0A9W6LSM0_9HYPH|nr:hypothetical protein [Methylocystis echinoides]GLI93591.1 hypothetical protein LMG27198_25830 [Methylocystis echinoides]